MPPINNILIKPVGPRCNLACRYCFYRRVADQYADKKMVMPTPVLEKMVKDFLELKLPMTSFCWQGGEPTLAGLPFFERAVELMQKHGTRGQQIGNALQTNGLRIDDAWIRFLARFKFLMGVSMDGPPDLHNDWRPKLDDGPSHDKAYHAAKNLMAGGVEVQILTTIGRGSEGRAKEVFDYMLKHDFRFIQIIPVVEFKPDGSLEDFSITAKGYGDYLCGYFDAWWELPEEERPSERTIDSAIAYYVEGKNPTCTFQPECGSYLLIENNGDVYPCDFYVRPDMRLGNLMDRPFYEFAESGSAQEFKRAKSQVHDDCTRCGFLESCWGDCQRCRDKGGKSVLCAGLKRFHAHSGERLKELAQKIAARRQSTPDPYRVF